MLNAKETAAKNVLSIAARQQLASPPSSESPHILSWYPRINKQRDRKNILSRDVALVQKRQTTTIENTAGNNKED
jgi:hypothetical protein